MAAPRPRWHGRACSGARKPRAASENWEAWETLPVSSQKLESHGRLKNWEATVFSKTGKALARLLKSQKGIVFRIATGAAAQFVRSRGANWPWIARGVGFGCGVWRSLATGCAALSTC